MRSFLQPVRVTAVLAVASAGLIVGPGTSPAVGAGSFCSVSGVSPSQIITWTGQSSAHPHDWDDADNWDPQTVPDAGQIKTIYQQDYVCIGHDHKGKAATVEITANKSHHIAGIEVGQGAQLTIDPGARLFAGSASSADVVDSLVDAGATLQVLAGTFGGNAPLTVHGTLELTGHKVGNKKTVATLTSSECVFDSSINACPGDTTPGGGDTTIADDGALLVDGKGFGGTVLGDQRYLYNAGAVTFSNVGYVLMNNNTRWSDEAGSSVSFEGSGGIYRGAKEGYPDAPSLHQQGKLTKDSKGTSVVGVPVTYDKGKQKVAVKTGTLDLEAPVLPGAKLARAAGYGSGSCTPVANQLCREPDATDDAPQTATVVTSTAGPKKSAIDVQLTDGPAKIKGKKLAGQQVQVTAPDEKTTHSTRLTFQFDGSVANASPTSTVFRGSKAIPLCKVHGLTAVNTSCVISEGKTKKGNAKGDLEIILITIQPKATWSVAK